MDSYGLKCPKCGSFEFTYAGKELTCKRCGNKIPFPFLGSTSGGEATRGAVWYEPSGSEGK